MNFNLKQLINQLIFFYYLFKNIKFVLIINAKLLKKNNQSNLFYTYLEKRI